MTKIKKNKGLLFGGRTHADKLNLTENTEDIVLSDPRRSYGAHKIASHLRENEWDIEVLDYFPSWTLAELKQYCKSRITTDTKFIGFSVVFDPIDWIKTATAFISWFKSKYDIPIIVGGVTWENIENFEADYYVTGWGEYAITEVLKHIENKSNILKYKTVNNKILVDANHSYPCWPKRKCSTKYEERDYILSDEPLSIELGRGCKFKCRFCHFPLLGVREDMTRDADDLTEEIKLNYDKWGTTSYLIADETVNESVSKIMKFGKACENLSFNLNMSAFLRGDIATVKKETWDPMISMGLTSHYYGVESFNHESAKWAGKGMNPGKLQDGLLELKEYFSKNSRNNYRGTISMIAGLPYDTDKTLDISEQWIYDNWKYESLSYFPLLIRKQGFEYGSMLDNEFESISYENDNSVEARFFRRKTYKHHSKDIMIWKNERFGTSFIKSYFRVNSFLEKFKEYNAISNWDVSLLKLFGNSSKKLCSKKILNHIDEYKRKKLS